MRGLLYDTGTAERDPVLAPVIVPLPDPAQARVECQAAQNAFDENRFIDAIAGFTRGVLNDMPASAGYAGLGRALLRVYRVSEAAAALRSALQRDSELTSARAELATAEQMLARFRLAAEQWQQVLLRDADYPDGRARLAILLYFLEDFDGAWSQIHAAEAAGQTVPAQLRELLAERMPEPP